MMFILSSWEVGVHLLSVQVGRYVGSNLPDFLWDALSPVVAASNLCRHLSNRYEWHDTPRLLVGTLPPRPRMANSWVDGSLAPSQLAARAVGLGSHMVDLTLG